MSINDSPTSVAVVGETVDQRIKIKNECKQKYMQVIYDLTVAKTAINYKVPKSLLTTIFLFTWVNFILN